MIYLTVKAALSGIIVMIVSEVARRSPGMGGLIASLPLVSILGIMWLWRDTPDVERIAAHAEVYVLVRLAVLADVSGLSSDAETRRRVLDRAWSIVRSDNGALRGDSMAPAQTRHQHLKFKTLPILRCHPRHGNERLSLWRHGALA